MFTFVIWVIGIGIVLWLIGLNLMMVGAAFESDCVTGLVVLALSLAGWMAVAVLVAT